MSNQGGKLDQSLDDILKTRNSSGRGGRRGARRGGAGRPAATAAPVGGVQKATKQAKQSRAVPTGPAASSGSGESKIMISNLPLDIEESQLKDYFASAANVGKPKKILMQYGPNGRSLGSATVIFYKPGHAADAVKAFEGIKIDRRPIKVEVLVSARDAPAPKQTALADRISQAKKDKPKPATADKEKGSAAAARGRGGRRGRGRGGRNPREKKKTLEELDAEMEDYFPAGEGGNAAAVTNGGAAGQNAGGDTAMDDEML